MQFDRKYIPDHILKQLYKSALLTRLVEEKMRALVTQKKIDTWLNGIGQEALSIGSTLAMEPDEWIFTIKENLGAFISRGVPLQKLLEQSYQKSNSYFKRREGGFYIGSQEKSICGTIKTNTQFATAAGVALAYKLKRQGKVSLVFTHFTETVEGDFHEALHLAAAWDLPIIFLIENHADSPGEIPNPVESFVERARGYGIESVQIGSNNILTLYDTVRGVREHCFRCQKPYIVECSTFRMPFSEGDSNSENRSEGLLDNWVANDPLSHYEEYMVDIRLFSGNDIKVLKSELKEYIESEWKAAFTSPLPGFEIKKDQKNAFFTGTGSENEALQEVAHEKVLKTKRFGVKNISFAEAIKENLLNKIKQHEEFLLLYTHNGESTEAFKVMEGLANEIGKNGVYGTYKLDSAIIYAAFGLSLEGFKSIVYLPGDNNINKLFDNINNILKHRYHCSPNSTSFVLRVSIGSSREPLALLTRGIFFGNTPGLKIVYPSSPQDAVALLTAAINDSDPVLFLEHIDLYNSVTNNIAYNDNAVEIGKAKLVRAGDEISVITYGPGVRKALLYAQKNTDVSLNILDLRTLIPPDYDAIRSAVIKTGKVLILHEDLFTGGICVEISGWIAEHCFHFLDAPVMRYPSFEKPPSFNIEDENISTVDSTLHDSIQKLLNY